MSNDKPAQAEGLQPIETIRYWLNAYSAPASGEHFMGHGMVATLLREYLQLRETEKQAGPVGYLCRHKAHVTDAIAAFGPDHDLSYLWRYTHGTKDLEFTESIDHLEVQRVYATPPSTLTEQAGSVAADEGQEWNYVIECRDGFVPNVKGPFTRRFTESTLREFAAMRPSYLMVVRSAGWPSITSGVEWIDAFGDGVRGRLYTAPSAPQTEQDKDDAELTDEEIKSVHDHHACLPDLVGLKDQWPQVLRFAREVLRAARAKKEQGQ